MKSATCIAYIIYSASAAFLGPALRIFQLKFSGAKSVSDELVIDAVIFLIIGIAIVGIGNHIEAKEKRLDRAKLPESVSSETEIERKEEMGVPEHGTSLDTSLAPIALSPNTCPRCGG